MSAFANALVNRIIDAVLRGQPLQLQSRYFVGLHTVQASSQFAGTEVSAGGYTRVAISSSMDNWSGTQAPASNTVSTGSTAGSTNNIPIVFPAAAADWGTIVGFGLYPVATGGAPEIYGSVVTPTPVFAGSLSTAFKAGDLLIQFDS